MIQDSFEFEAPKGYNFLAERRVKHPMDISIDLTDPNDYWFMITHVELSPIKPNDDVSEDQSRNQPIRRTSIAHQIQFVEQKKGTDRHNEETKDEESEVVQRKQPIKKRKTVIKHNKPIVQVKSIVPPNRYNRKEVPAKQQQRAQSKPSLKPLHYQTRSYSVGVLTKSRKDQSKDNRPCPYPPRIQRQWQNNSKQTWYSLSPDAKVDAQKMMAQIKEARKPKKSQSPRQKDKKSSKHLKF